MMTAKNIRIGEGSNDDRMDEEGERSEENG
jgi:hypothetical protein